MNKKRLDKLLTDKKLVESREKAAELIKAGNIKVNGKIIKKPSYKVDENSKLEVLKEFPYVSRAGLKLERALHKFNINVKDKVCLDIGASTGGFTDCLLKHGAKKVYAVDVGKNQLHETLKTNPKVISYEKTDARILTQNHIKDKIDILVSDVSFISVLKVLPPVLKFLKEDFEGVILIKPQFELSPEEVNRSVIKDKQKHIKAIKKVLEGLNKLGIGVVNLDYSYPFGTDGNIEFLANIKFKDNNLDFLNIEEIVENAHRKLKEEKNGSS